MLAIYKNYWQNIFRNIIKKLDYCIVNLYFKGPGMQPKLNTREWEEES